MNGEEGERGSYGTDGSMIPANARPGDRRTVTAACVSECNGLGAVITGREAVVMQGELFGIIMALIRARMERKPEVHIHSDYLNGIRKITDMTSGRLNLEQSAGRSWYRWIHMLWQELEEMGTKISQ